MTEHTPAGSPFFFGGAVPPERFFGRERERTELYDAAAKLGMRAIVGERGIGKSSLLRKVEHDYRSRPEIPEGARLVRLSTQDAHCHHQASFLACVVGKLLAHVRHGNTPDHRVLLALQARCEEEKPELSLVEFGEAVEQLHRVGLRPVVCIDEFEGFFEREEEFDRDFFDGLRFLNDNGWIGYLLASRTPLKELFKGKRRVSIFPRNVQTAHLGAFSKDEAKALLNQPSNRPFSEEEIDWLIKETKRHPPALQAMADELYRAKARPSIDRREVAGRCWESLEGELKPPHRRGGSRSLWKRIGLGMRNALKFVFVKIPIAVGKLTKFLGEGETWEWVRGMLTLALVVGVLVGAITFDDLYGWVREMIAP